MGGGGVMVGRLQGVYLVQWGNCTGIKGCAVSRIYRFASSCVVVDMLWTVSSAVIRVLLLMIVKV